MRRFLLPLAVWWAVGGALTADEPAAPRLTTEEQRLAREASRLNREGAALLGQGQAADAFDKVRRALEVRRQLYPKSLYPDGHPELAESLSQLGAVLSAMGAPDRALPQFEAALAMRRTLYPQSKFPDGHPDLARSLDNLGVALEEMAAPEKALPHLEAALAMRRKLYPESKYPAGHPELAASLDNLGGVLNSVGAPEKALPHIEAALAMRRQLYPEAKYPDGHPELATSLNNLGHVLESIGARARALPYFESALAMRRRLYPVSKYPDGHPDIAVSLNNLGFVLQTMGKPARGLPHHYAALAMYRRLYPVSKYPDGHPLLAASLTNLGMGLDAAGLAALAVPNFEAALAMRRKLYPESRYPEGHPDLAQSFNHVGAALNAMGERARALPHFEAALAMVRRLYPESSCPEGHPVLAPSLNCLGQVLRAMGEPARALPYYEAALAMYRRLAASLAAARAEGEALNLLAAQPATLGQLLSAASDAGAAPGRSYGSAWRAKAGLARVYQRRHLAAHAAAVVPAARAAWDEETALRRERAALLLALPPPTEEGRTERDRSLAELDRALARSRAKLRDLLPELARADELAERPPADLQQALPARSAFIDFIRYTRYDQDPDIKGYKGEKRKECYTAFVVTNESIRRIELGPAAPVEKVVRDWRKALQQEAEPPADLAAALRLALWEPVEALLPAGTNAVYLAPDGPLAFVPFAALPGKAPGSVLLEEFAVAVVPSGPFLLDQLCAAKAKNAKAGLLAVGDVGYGLDPAASWLLAAAPAPTRGPAAGEGQLSTWAPLPGTARELARVAEMAGAAKIAATRLSGADAAVGRLVAELPRHRYAHLATHGFFLSDESTRKRQRLDESLFRSSGDERMGAAALSPFLLSGLACAGANKPGTPSRGLLTAEHLLDADLTGMSLCVLSACETGLGEFRQGEGVFGLQQALHIAGCRDVVASLWAVSDEATAALMGLFYRNLWEKGLPPIEALRQAQLELRRNPALAPGRSLRKAPATEVALNAGTVSPQVGEGAKPGRYAPPQKWAAFVLSGSGR